MLATWYFCDEKMKLRFGFASTLLSRDWDSFMFAGMKCASANIMFMWTFNPLRFGDFHRFHYLKSKIIWLVSRMKMMDYRSESMELIPTKKSIEKMKISVSLLKFRVSTV
jgi:hypothetical protein